MHAMLDHLFLINMAGKGRHHLMGGVWQQFSELRALAALHAGNRDAAASRASSEAAVQLQQQALQRLWSNETSFLGTLKVPGPKALMKAPRLQSR